MILEIINDNQGYLNINVNKNNAKFVDNKNLFATIKLLIKIFIVILSYQ